MLYYTSMFVGLRNVKQFQTLDDDELREILTAGDVRNLKAGETIFFQDEPCAGMYVLVKGRVNLCKLGPGGQQNILATIKPVIMFNEVSVLDQGNNPVTAFTMEDSTLWRISCQKFQDLLTRFPSIATGLLRVMAARNRRLIEHYEDLSYRSVEARVAKLLLDLSQNGSLEIIRREHSIEEMASLVATVSPVISRTLSNFKQLGLLKTSRNTINLEQVDELVRIARLDLNFLDEFPPKRGAKEHNDQ